MPQGNEEPYTFNKLCHEIYRSTDAENLEALHRALVSELAFRQSIPWTRHIAEFRTLSDEEMFFILCKVVSAITGILRHKQMVCSELQCAGRHLYTGPESLFISTK